MTDTFKPGDVVWLKSGGRAMTVRMDRSGDEWSEAASVTGNRMGVYCSWQCADGAFAEGVFAPEQLTKQEPDIGY